MQTHWIIKLKNVSDSYFTGLNNFIFFNQKFSVSISSYENCTLLREVYSDSAGFVKDEY